VTREQRQTPALPHRRDNQTNPSRGQCTHSNRGAYVLGDRGARQILVAKEEGEGNASAKLTANQRRRAEAGTHTHGLHAAQARQGRGGEETRWRSALMGNEQTNKKMPSPSSQAFARVPLPVPAYSPISSSPSGTSKQATPNRRQKRTNKASTPACCLSVL
jgi:hypothetical protein